MKNKKVCIGLLVISMGILLVPFAGMSKWETTETTEKRTLAAFPSISDENGFNVDILSELGDWFEDHFAFRNQIVAMDSKIQSTIFKESDVSTIIYGENDWLYYQASLDDYLGQNTVTERGAFNIAHNIALMQKKLTQENKKFLFTIAPNKNSLYDENMPYYDSVKASDTKNLTLVTPLLEQLEVNYADLYQAFESQDEILYLKRDSHWNEKGAVLAYNTIMDAIDKKHEDYSMTEVVRTKTKVGDLATALYSVDAEPEWDCEYQYDSNLTFNDDFTSWENEWVQTKNKKAKGSVLMFRDSFGNTLSKYVAEAYKKGTFIKSNVYFLDKYLEETKAKTVIVEIVERNLDRFGKFTLADQFSYGPAVMTPPVADVASEDLPASGETDQALADASLTVSEQLASYYVLSGQIDTALINDDTDVLVEVTNGGKATVYDAYTVSSGDGEEASDNGYVMYLDSADITAQSIQIRVFTKTDGQYQLALETELNVPEQ